MYYMHVCMYVCMYVCMCVYVYVRNYVDALQGKDGYQYHIGKDYINSFVKGIGEPEKPYEG